MCARKVKKEVVMIVGFVLLAVANVGKWWLERHSGLPEDMVDTTSGLLFGLAIGTMIWGIILTARASHRK